jgi:hypothetical protein
MVVKEAPPEVLRRAQEADQLLRRLTDRGITRPDNTPEDWLKMGTEIWPHSYSDNATDAQAFKKLAYFIDTEYVRNPLDRIAAFRKLTLQVPDSQCRYLWAARWVDQGCPRVVIEPKYAALLMATDVGRGIVEHVIPPWKAFFIEVPTDLLTIEDEQGEHDSIRYVMFQELVNDFGDRICNIIGAGSRLSLWRHSVPLTEIADPSTTEEKTDWGVGIEFTSRDDRVVKMMGRLVLSACVALMDSSNYHRQKSRARASTRHRLGKGLKEIQSFVLGKPVSINCRQAILDFIDGSHGSRQGPKVQFIVRGHWKHQPYGSGRSLRKFIRIDPYWKGPEDAKILTRTVELGQTKEGP